MEVNSSKSRNILHALQYTVFAAAILYFGKQIFIPISFAALISFVIYPICAWLEKRGVSRLTAIVINVSLLVLIVVAVVSLMIAQFVTFVDEWPGVQLKLVSTSADLSNFLMDSFGLSQDLQSRWFSHMMDQAGSGFLHFLQQTVSISVLSAVNLLVLIPVYTVLILYYRGLWLSVLCALFPGEKKEQLIDMLLLTIRAYHNFIKGMALVYLLVGVLNSVGLLLLGVPHAILFGFIASVLTFIPYIGIIIGSLLPITMAWISHDSIWYPVAIVAIFTFVQYLEANVIFPLSVSSRLRVNTLVMLIAIFVGGLLWGMAGMILFVPFVGMAKLIADHSPSLQTLSLILGPDPAHDKSKPNTNASEPM